MTNLKEVNCVQCGKKCIGRNSRSFCSNDCRQERKRLRDRANAERRRRRNGVTAYLGVTANCSICRAPYVMRSHKSKTCSENCSQERSRRIARKRSEKYRREAGVEKVGGKASCEHCGDAFVKRVSRAKYCQTCKELSQKNALPFMREWSNGYRKEWHAQKMAEDPVYALLITTRNSISDAIRRMGYTKRNRSYKILGCSWEFFKGHIEAQFQPGMTWDDRGEWELDHIVPVSSARSEKEVARLNHYTNFQPLWKEQNRAKGAKMGWRI